MQDHPAESQREYLPGIVTRVYPDTWEVDVQPLLSTSGTVLRAKVVGDYLPEVHTEERQSKVLVGRLNGLQQAPVAIPVHNTIIPDADKPNYVQWLQLLNFRITIKRDGELEIRNQKDPDRLLRIRIREDGNEVRIDTPKTRIICNDDDGNVTIEADQDVTVNCTNASVNASANIAATAVGNVDITGGGIVRISGGLVEIN